MRPRNPGEQRLAQVGTEETRSRGRPRYDIEDQHSAASFLTFAKSIQIDRKDASPLWIQLKNAIEEGIVSGALAESSRLPSEQAMCEIFDLSRPVIRAALQGLSTEGRVIKQPRKGMFVAPRLPRVDIMTLPLGVFDDLLSKGYKVSVKTHAFGLHDASEEERRVFQLPDGFQVIRILRTYFANEVPFTHTHISLPAHRLPGFEKLDIEGKSIFGTIRELYGLTVSRADRLLKAASLPADAAQRMGLPAGSPMIFIESSAYDHDGNALEYYRAYYNSDMAPIRIATDQIGH